MATTKKNNNVTKVICQNCGAEVIIPNHEFAIAGMAIGKDSGLGTVVLPTKCCDENASLQKLSELSGVSVSAVQAVLNIIGKIEDDGYLDVNGIVRRWIPSQCLHMLYSEDGFHASLQYRGYEYCWKVLVDDLKKQSVLYVEKDMEAYADRNRWYNKELAKAMAKDYIEQLRYHVEKELSVHSHNGRPYKKIKCGWMNNGKGVHIDEMSVFFNKMQLACNAIGATKAPGTLYDTVARFNNLRMRIGFQTKNICPAFFNAYKAAGAYYTMKDLIMFENCLMKVDKDGSVDRPLYFDYGRSKRDFVEMEESLAALERKTSEVVKTGVLANGYMMLGLLKDFLAYNNFDMDATTQKWKEQSELRKMARSMKRGERRSRK